MAQSGASTVEKGVQVGEMIRPVKASAKCRVHGEEELKSYCEDCKVFSCVECYYEKHESHKTVLARTVVDRIRGELQSSKPKLEQWQKQADDNLTEVTKTRDEMEKRHAEELKNVKERHEKEVSELNKEDDEVQQYAESLETLISEVSDIGSTSSLEALADLKPRVDDAAAKLLPAVQRQLPPLMRKVESESKKIPKNSGEMAMLRSSLQAVKGVVAGQAYDVPEILYPSPTEHYNYKDGTVTFVPSEAGQQLATLLHVTEPAVLSDVGPNNYIAMTSGGKATHIHVQLYKQPECTGIHCWAPASLPVSDVIHRVTGKRPSKVVTYAHNVDVRHKTLSEWRSNSGASMTLSYWE